MKPSQTQSSTHDLFASAQYVEQLLNSELQWLSNRISWLFISQAFCLAAHAVLVTAQQIQLENDFNILKWALPIFGILSCVFVYVSVWAARKVAYHLADQRALLTRKINLTTGLHIPLIGASMALRDPRIHWTRWAGGATHHALPLTLFLIWFGLLVSRLIETFPKFFLWEFFAQIKSYFWN